MLITADNTAPAQLIESDIQHIAEYHKSPITSPPYLNGFEIHRNPSAKNTIPSEIYQISINDIRSASDALTLKISDQEFDALQKEHKAFIQKKYSSGLSQSEVARHDIVKWKIGRVNEARMRPSLERLEKIATTQMQIAEALKENILSINK